MHAKFVKSFVFIRLCSLRGTRINPKTFWSVELLPLKSLWLELKILQVLFKQIYPATRQTNLLTDKQLYEVHPWCTHLRACGKQLPWQIDFECFFFCYAVLFFFLLSIFCRRLKLEALGLCYTVMTKKRRIEWRIRSYEGNI